MLGRALGRSWCTRCAQRGTALAVVVLSLVPSSVARGGTPDAGRSGVAADGPPALPLPRLVEPALPEPEAADLARLDGLVARLLAADLKERSEAARQVREVDSSWLPAVAQRFEQLAEGANRPALRASLERIRDQARAEHDRTSARGSEAAPSVTPDHLAMLVAHPDRSSAFLRPLTEVVAYSRMFEAMRTLPAARRVVSVYVRFGEFLRVDTQLALARMKDASIAALIEATAHPEPRIASWAKNQLDDLGKSVASEAVQVTDPVLRADILRAYGKVRDLETTRLLIAFAASEGALERLAARQAVTMLGEAALWELRDAYEKTVGERAPRGWPWERVASELFAEVDRQRQAEIYSLFSQGRAAAKRGDLDAAKAAFDRVLAYDPLFERGPQLAPTYFALAQRLAESDREAATLALRRAERLDPSGPFHAPALSLRHTLEARALLERGIVDEVLIQRARDLDPENQRAEALQNELAARSGGDRVEWRGYLAAAVIALSSVVGLLVMAVRQRRAQRASAVTPT